MAATDRAVEVDRFPGAMERFGGAMERFGGAGMALLPWTRHMIAVLWDQLRVLVQVIYYTFISVFQMFRFEVHVRITDDPSVTPDPSDPFLFSSLFSEEDGADHTEALLSTLRGEELRCDGEGGIFIGHKGSSRWTATVGDWNFFVSSSETRSSDEERSASCWSSEEEHLEFDCDESKALWESLSRSGDPYDPFCFSACISTRSKALWDSEPRGHKDMRSEASWETESRAAAVCEEHLKAGEETEASWETESRAAAVCEEHLKAEEETEASWETESGCSPGLDEDWEAESCEGGPVPVGRFWESSSDEASDAELAVRWRGGVRRSDSDSSWSSDGSENSENLELQQENQLLWDLFSNNDPYNPLCFSAAARGPPEVHQDELWRGLPKEQDPYHPLNFSALELTAGRRNRPQGALQSCKPRRQRGVKPSLTQRSVQRHSHPQLILRPWTRSPPSAPAGTRSPPSAPAGTRSPPSAPQRGRQTQKKVRFSDEVQVHVMRSWDFARRSSRRGTWEELARDRDRFRRRVQDSERTVGLVLSPEHRDRVQRRIRAWTEPGAQRPGPEEDQGLGWTGSTGGSEPGLSED